MGKTLFVDDDKDILDIYRRECEDAGLTDVAFAETADAAIEILKAGEIEHLICDGKIPRMDGGLAREAEGLRVLTSATKLGVPERWVVSSMEELQRYACKEGLANFACAKLDVVSKLSRTPEEK